MSPASHEPHGVLVVDKDPGATSHDVVHVARRALGTRSVGHTGTLDPMATGVLILVVGEATKLSSLLGVGDKVYEAVLRLGIETSSLDADGDVVGERPVPAFSEREAAALAAGFVGTHAQQVPRVSAVKVAGRPLHERARKGEVVDPPVRQVRLDAVAVQKLDEAHLRLSLRCGKGFYVRSFGRDLAARLGTVGHLSVLRRLENAGFSLSQSVSFSKLLAARPRDAETARREVREALLPLTAVCERLPRLALDEVGAEHARHGRRIPLEHVTQPGELPEPDAAVVARTRSGVPLAIVTREPNCLRVARGFASTSRPAR